MRVENDTGVYRQTSAEAGFRPENPKEHRPSRWWIPVVVLIAAALLVVFGILPRIQARTALRQETTRMSVPTVSVVQAKRSAPAQEIILPASVQAFYDAPIYARTNGYLRHWYVDIGTHVKAGQLLADIETPEVDQQLSQARAQLATAQADYKLAKSTADRWQDLRKTDSVAQQETEEKIGDMESKSATVEAARANVRRLEELQSFQKI